MAVHKQERVLKRNAPIIVATPGRLWDIIKDDFIVGFKERLPLIDLLVLDEADRMLEDGHFRELKYILNFIYVTKAKHLKLAGNGKEAQPKLTEILKVHDEENRGGNKFKMKLVEGGIDADLLDAAEMVEAEAD